MGKEGQGMGELNQTLWMGEEVYGGGQFVVAEPLPELSEHERLDYEHRRRQAIEDVRHYDMLLYGRRDKTIPERKR